MGEKSSPTKFRGEKKNKKYWEETNTNQPPRDLSLLEMSWTSKKKCPALKNNQPPTNRTLRAPQALWVDWAWFVNDLISRQKGKGKIIDSNMILFMGFLLGFPGGFVFCTKWDVV